MDELHVFFFFFFFLVTFFLHRIPLVEYTNTDQGFNFPRHSFTMSSPQRLRNKVAIVTGASRGIGKGIATELALAGACVYITGRTKVSSKTSPGSLDDAANEINAMVRESNGSGRCEGLLCDHSDDEQTKAVFARVAQAHGGRLDILVNNAYAAVTAIMETGDKKFWEKPLRSWDLSHNVGLRSHFVCSVLATKLMIAHKVENQVIVNISSFGGLEYAWFANDIPYGVGKCALDRLSADMAYELLPHKIACISLWPGAVKTELVDMYVGTENSGFANGESTRFAGRTIAALSTDKKLLSRTGKVILTSQLAEELGFTDVDGTIPASHMPTVDRLRGRMKIAPNHWVLNAPLLSKY